MASCGYSDKNQTAHVKKEVGPRHGNVPTNRAQRGPIAVVQSSFNESNDPDFLRSFFYK